MPHTNYKYRHGVKYAQEFVVSGLYYDAKLKQTTWEPLYYANNRAEALEILADYRAEADNIEYKLVSRWVKA